MRLNYNEELAQELAVLRDKTKRGMLPLVIRNPTLEGVTARYVDGLESYMETRDNPPIALRNADLLHKAADIVLYEELTWSHPDKMSILEYPVMSDFQTDVREEKFTHKADLKYGDLRFKGRRKVSLENKLEAFNVSSRRVFYASDDGMGDVDTAVIVRDALDNAGLTERQRQAITLVYFDNLTQEDARYEMGVSKATMSEHITIALRKLKRYLTKNTELYSV